MNERGKTEPPLQSRDSVTRHVTSRFVSPLPPASILATPNALKGSRPSSSANAVAQTARTTPNSRNALQQQQQTLMIAAPPQSSNTARSLLLMQLNSSEGGGGGGGGARHRLPKHLAIATSPSSHNNSNNVHSSNSGFSPQSPSLHQLHLTNVGNTSSASFQTSSSNAGAGAKDDPYDDDDNLPIDCPPSRRMESAKRKIVQLSNTILAAELANEMRPELYSEIASKDIVKKLLQESTPHVDEIKQLLEGMIRRGGSGLESFEVSYQKNQNNNHYDHQHRGENYDDDDDYYVDEQERTRAFDETNTSQTSKPGVASDRDIIRERLSIITDPGAALQYHQQQHQKQRAAALSAASRRQSLIATSGIARRPQITGNNNNNSNNNQDTPLPLMIAMRPPDGDGNNSNKNNNAGRRASSSSSPSRQRQTLKESADLVAEDDVEASLSREAKPMLIETSRGLSALQRALQSVVDIFDAISASQQRAFQHYIDKWFRTASDILPTIQASVAPSDFLQVKQFLLNTHKTATDSRDKLLGLSDHMFAKAREAASGIAVGVAESRDSVMKMQHVVNDLKAELALAATLIPPSMYNSKQQQQQQQQQQQNVNNNNTNNAKSDSAANSARARSPENNNTHNNNNNTNNVASGSFQQSASFSASSSPAVGLTPSPSSATYANGDDLLSVSSGSQQQQQQQNQQQVTSSVAPRRGLQNVPLPPPSLLNTYAGTTFVCVSLENLVNVVYPGCGKEYVPSSFVGNSSNKLSEMSILFAKHGATAPFAASMMGKSLGNNNDKNNTNNSASLHPLHSFTSGKNALSLVRALVSNTVTPCNGHIIAMRPFGPFLVAFDSVSSAVTWSRGIQLYGSCIPWPEDLLENPAFSLVPTKKTKIDPKDPTGLERAINSGTMSAQILMDSQIPPPAVNQMSITEDIFFNAWRSMLSDGSVTNGPGGALAHKISRLSLLQMREVFNFLQRGRLFEKRGPRFKIGMSFESLTSVISSSKSVQNLQRGGGFRTAVAAATSLCAIARGGHTIASYDLANLFAESRNATSLDVKNASSKDGKKPGTASTTKDSSVSNNNNTTISGATSSKAPADASTTTTTTSASPSSSSPSPSSSGSSIVVQAEEQGLKLLIAPPSSKDQVQDALGVSWLPLALLPERHRFTLRQCGTERIFEVKYAPANLQPAHLADSASSSSSKQKGQTDGELQGKSSVTGGKKTRQQLEAERRRKQRKELHHGDDDDNDHDHDGGDVDDHDGDEGEHFSIAAADHRHGDHDHRNNNNNNKSFAATMALENAENFFDPAAEHFDVMWFSRDDVTGGGGAAIVRPLQLSYLLPPIPLQPKLCTRECQSDPVCITISNNHNNAFPSSLSPSSSPGGTTITTAVSKRSSSHSSPGGTTRILFSADGTTRNLLPMKESAYNPGDDGEHSNNQSATTLNQDDLENVAAAFLEGAITTDTARSNKTKNNNTASAVSPLRSPSATTARSTTGAVSGNLSARKQSGNSKQQKKKKKKSEAPAEIEIKIPPVMVERSEQTMLDQNYSLCPGGSAGVFFRDNDRDAAEMNLKKMSKMGNNSDTDDETARANAAKLENNVELYQTSQGYAGRDSMNDDSAAAVVDVCNLFENLIQFLSGTSNFADLLHGVTSFIGVLQLQSSQSSSSSKQSHEEDNVMQHQQQQQQQQQLSNFEDNLQDDEEAIGLTVARNSSHSSSSSSSSSPSWNLVADTLLQHLVARLTFPVPPAQSTTFRLVVGGIIACVAEFVRSVPDREASASKERFRQVFSGVTSTNSASLSFGKQEREQDQQQQDENQNHTSSSSSSLPRRKSKNDDENDDDGNEETTIAAEENPFTTTTSSSLSLQPPASSQNKKRIDPSLQALSVVASIAQLIKIAPLDSADEMAAAATHASQAHERIRRRSKANEAVIEQMKQTASNSSRRNVVASMAATVRNM